MDRDLGGRRGKQQERALTALWAPARNGCRKQCGLATHWSLPSRDRRRSHGKQPIRTPRSKNETHWAMDAEVLVMHLLSPQTSFPTQVTEARGSRSLYGLIRNPAHVSWRKTLSLARCSLLTLVEASKMSSK